MWAGRPEGGPQKANRWSASGAGAPCANGHANQADAEQQRDRRLGRGLRGAVEHGLLVVGDALPSERDIAEGLGVSRVTVHKWWSHRVELVEEALFPDFGTLPTPDAGAFEQDLELLVEQMVEHLTQLVLVIGMPALRAEIASNPRARSAKLRGVRAN